MKAKNIESIYELSPLQQGLIFHCLYSPESGVYFSQFNCAFPNLNVEAFKSAWQFVIERHPVFRTAFFWKELHKPLQVVERRTALPLEEKDWRRLSSEEQQSQLDRFLEEDRARGFDLERAPLMRLTLIRTGESSYQFIWSHHHLLLDGWSVAVVLNEVFADYEAKLSGQSLQLPPARPFSDYVAWLSQRDEAGAERFWRKYLSGFTAATSLPASFDKSEKTGYGEAEGSLTVEQTAAVRALARRARVTLNTIVGGAWGVLLARSAGVEDVVYGAVVAGRPAELEGVERMVGLFINTLPVRVQVRDEMAVEEWLQGLQREAAAVRQYEHTSLAQVQRWSEMPAATPLFNTILRFQNYPLDLSSNDEDATLRISADVSIDWWHYPLCLVATAGEEMSLRLSYRRDSLDEDAAADVLDQLRNLLGELVQEATSTSTSRPSRAFQAHP